MRKIFGLVVAACLATGASAGTLTLMGAGPGVKVTGGGSCTMTTLDFTTGSLPGGVTFTGGTNATYYNSTNKLTNAVTNTSRFTYKPSTGAGPYILVEPAHTNYIVNSESFAGTWGQTNSSFISGKTDPRGNAFATMLSENAATGTHDINQAQGTGNTAPLASVDVTISGFFKQDVGSRNGYLRIADSAFAGTVFMIVNPSTGAIVSGPTLTGTYTGTPVGSVETINISGNVWYRAKISGAIANAGTSNASSGFRLTQGTTTSYAGDNSSGVDIFGYQASPTSTVTLANSYVATTASTATSTADAVAFTIPSGCGHLTYTFDDASTQTVAVSSGAYTVPTNLNRPWIATISGAI